MREENINQKKRDKATFNGMFGRGQICEEIEQPEESLEKLNLEKKKRIEKEVICAFQFYFNDQNIANIMLD